MGLMGPILEWVKWIISIFLIFLLSAAPTNLLLLLKLLELLICVAEIGKSVRILSKLGKYKIFRKFNPQSRPTNFCHELALKRPFLEWNHRRNWKYHWHFSANLIKYWLIEGNLNGWPQRVWMEEPFVDFHISSNPRHGRRNVGELGLKSLRKLILIAVPHRFI